MIAPGMDWGAIPAANIAREPAPNIPQAADMPLLRRTVEIAALHFVILKTVAAVQVAERLVLRPRCPEFSLT
jgi:hypothetical protein